ncbi:alpha/beta fold hydrolase [Paenibacillus sp. KN14-4R]|uniref:alpha/beta fold hydrolase n=1 Tax=Paenibacillus sp. KN14-4R TaxID=3445773 RepID=UPI003FA04B87
MNQLLEPIVREWLDFASEIQARDAQYFQKNRLRVYIPHITSQLFLVMEHAATLLKIELEWVVQTQSMQAIERLFHQRMMHVTAQTNHLLSHIPDSMIAPMVDGIYQEYQQRQLLQRQEDDRNLASVVSKSIPMDGVDLHYTVAGTGSETFVLVHAFGLPICLWDQMVAKLMKYGKVIVWQPRGSDLDGGVKAYQPLEAHVADLLTLLSIEGVSRPHIISWCTGAKVAIEYALQSEEQEGSLIFLNASLKGMKGLEDFQTIFEKDLYAICQAALKSPRMAPIFAQTLNQKNDRITQFIDEEHESIALLGEMNESLRHTLREPLATGESLHFYTQQLHDYWNRDYMQQLSTIEIPTLFITAEYDHIASPQMSALVAEQMNDAHFASIQGGSHYMFVQQSELILDMIIHFIQSKGTHPYKHHLVSDNNHQVIKHIEEEVRK